MKKITNIFIFGSSIVWGKFDPEGGGWATRLRNYFESLEKNYLVYNLGVSADTTECLLERFESEVDARQDVGEDSIIIFAAGLNDSMFINPGGEPTVTEEVFQDNISKLIDGAKKFTETIIFVGPTIVDESQTIPWEDDGRSYSNERIKKFSSIIKLVCQKDGVAFMDMLDILNKDDLYDGLHPNSTGHQKMFERVKNYNVRMFIKTLGDGLGGLAS